MAELLETKRLNCLDRGREASREALSWRVFPAEASGIPYNPRRNSTP